MKLYITGSYAIAPNFDAEKGVAMASFFPENKYHQAKEPNYKEIIDPKASRRMARIIKMGIAAATKSLQEAKVTNPGAILVGTGLGCLQDTEKFLADVVENKEILPSPSAFIQSTHNTIAGQIALLLNCYEHNFTFVQRGHSFECALEDAFLQLEEGADNILVGGIDEITPSLFEIFFQMDCVGNLQEKEDNASNQQNPVMGEGASFFNLSREANSAAKASIDGLDCFYNADTVESIEIHIIEFLDSLNMQPDDVSAIMLGENGDQKDDKTFKDISEHLFHNKTLLSFKNICGEYFTSTAFAVYLASEILHSQKIPDEVFIAGTKISKLENILIYNHYRGNYHTLMLLSRCQLLK